MAVDVDVPVVVYILRQERARHVHAAHAKTSCRCLYRESNEFWAMCWVKLTMEKVRIFNSSTRPSVIANLKKAVTSSGGTFIVDLVEGRGFM